jgi:serine/threonine protein kinase
MSDPQHAPLPDLPVSLGEEDQASLLSGSAESTDDTPTIISRNQPRPPAPEEPFGPLRGRHLAHFELIEPIGVGGMAAVLRARDTQLDRFVALKILPPEMAADAENVRRFHQEARSAAKLDHENIARVFFCGEDQRLHFIAFEFVEGENLRTILERRGRLPVHEALRYLIQVAAGLAHASRRGVVHRDIKPSNIIITPNERAKLVDMGLARTLEPHDSNDLTQSGVTLGTFDYISPEQALEPREADVRSDIYSLGCTFYHMLTGQPPVPEGTAAKKLHHHQHIQPTDPRLLVPDLPDEVAIILSRMMAKNPRDRYQSPEQLVHHLLLAARKLNVSADVPEGVLTLEAALPAPPAGRPLLLATLAACAVVLLIFLLGRSTPSPAPPPLLPRPPAPPTKDKANPGPAEVARQGNEAPAPPPKKGTSPPPSERASEKVITTAEELTEWLHNDKRENLILRVSGVLDLSPIVDPSRQEQGGYFQNRASVAIVPARRGQTAVIRLRYDGKASRYDDPAARGVRAALSFDNVQKVRIEGIRFQIDGNTSGVPMAAVWLSGGQSHVIQDCEFVQARPVLNEERKRMASLFAEARIAPQDGRQEPATPTLSVEGCCFLGFPHEPRSRGLDGDLWSFSGVEAGGHDAVRCRGPLQVSVKNSAFGPHRSMFRIERLDSQPGMPRLDVDHCSFRAGQLSSVYSLSEDASPVIAMSHSLVSADGVTLGSEDDSDPVLVRQVGARSKLDYKGEDNRYYNMSELTSQERELRSQDLRESPWQEPLAFKALDAGLEGKALSKAFQVRAGMPELRLGTGKNITLAGVEQVAGVSYLEKLPPLDKPKEVPPRTRTLIVNPAVARVQEGVSPVYPTLSVAIDRARSGDLILIKHTGELKLEPISLNKASLSDLTIAAARGSRPVLTLGNVEDPDACLFRIHGGKLRLEHLELRLQPGNPAFKSQCVFSLMGSGQCLLNDCVLTLEPGDLEVPLAVAVLPDPGGQVKVDMPESRSSEQGPRLELNNCLVRGSGDLLWARATRPAELILKNTQAVLTGSVLTVKGGKDETTPASGRLLLQLDYVTTYLGGHLLKMKAAGGLKYLEPVECKANNCLFLAAPESDYAMIHLEGPSAAEKNLPDKVQWAAGRNAYGGFSYPLAQVSADTEMRMPRGLNPDQWKTFSGEADSRSNAKLSASLGDIRFTWVMPAQLTPEASLRDYGAQHIDKLPLPAKR